MKKNKVHLFICLGIAMCLNTSFAADQIDTQVIYKGPTSTCADQQIPDFKIWKLDKKKLDHDITQLDIVMFDIKCVDGKPQIKLGGMVYVPRTSIKAAIPHFFSKESVDSFLSVSDYVLEMMGQVQVPLFTSSSEYYCFDMDSHQVFTTTETCAVDTQGQSKNGQMISQRILRLKINQHLAMARIMSEKSKSIDVAVSWSSYYSRLPFSLKMAQSESNPQLLNILLPSM
jgi:hypothetical protein